MKAEYDKHDKEQSDLLFSEWLDEMMRELKIDAKSLSLKVEISDKTIRAYRNHKTEMRKISEKNKVKIKAYIKSASEYHFIYDDKERVFRHIASKDFNALLKLLGIPKLTQTEQAEILGTSQSSCSRESFFFGTQEQYEIVRRLHERLVSGVVEIIYRFNDVPRKVPVYVREYRNEGEGLGQILEGKATFYDGMFISYVAMEIAALYIEPFSDFPDNVKQILKRYIERIQTQFDDPYNSLSAFRAATDLPGFCQRYINAIAQMSKRTVSAGMNKSDYIRSFCELIDIRSLNRWLEPLISEALNPENLSDTAAVMSCFNEHGETMSYFIKGIFGMMSSGKKRVKPKLDERDFFSLRGWLSHTFMVMLNEFSELSLKEQNIVLDNLNAFVPPLDCNNKVKYFTVRFIKRYRLLDEQKKREICEELKKSPSISISQYDFDVIADCRNMMKLTAAISAGRKNDKDAALAKKNENVRKFKLSATIPAKQGINIMGAVKEKLSFTSDEWYVWMLVENCLRADAPKRLSRIYDMMPGDFKDENTLTGGEIKSYLYGKTDD